jgi:predicted SPOUT superfamily RNA methylase MTH1
MALMGMKLAVSVPDTVLEEKDSLREKTVKLGHIARACSIYGVDVVEVFGDPRGRGEGTTITKVLQYLETPQYLRRRLYPLDETLKYAGILPPLRIPSHRPRVPMDRIPVGQVREGVVNVDGTVDVGLEVPLKLRGKASGGKRVTVRVVSVRPPTADLIPREEAGEYWGYSVETKSLADVLSDARFPVKIATSRLGEPLGSTMGRLRAKVRGAAGVKLIFGSPARGLYDIVGRDLGRKVDLVVNLFPEQKVETVRTEEAVFAGLGLLSLVSAEKA